MTGKLTVMFARYENMKNSEMTYEQAVTRLEEIVALLEKKDTPLEDRIKLFEEGTKLAAFCNEKLATAKQKITELTKDD